MNISRFRVTIAAAGALSAGLCLALAPGVASAQSAVGSHSHRAASHRAASHRAASHGAASHGAGRQAAALDTKAGCSPHVVCVWSARNYSRTDARILASAWRNRWYGTASTFGFEPRSGMNGSGSAVYVWDSGNREAWCLAEGQSSSDLDRGFNYFYITYDRPRCGQVHLPPPPGGWRGPMATFLATGAPAS